MKLKKILLLFIFAATSFIVTAQTVHYTKTGHKYHSAGCQYLRQSDYTCSLSEAMNKGLTACSKCDPPTTVVKDTKPKMKAVKDKKVGYYYNHSYTSKRFYI